MTDSLTTSNGQKAQNIADGSLLAAVIGAGCLLTGEMQGVQTLAKTGAWLEILGMGTWMTSLVYEKMLCVGDEPYMDLQQPALETPDQKSTSHKLGLATTAAFLVATSGAVAASEAKPEDFQSLAHFLSFPTPIHLEISDVTPKPVVPILGG